MQVQSVNSYNNSKNCSNNVNFNGKFIKVGKFSDSELRYIDEFINSICYGDSNKRFLSSKPYDVIIKKDNEQNIGLYSGYKKFLKGKPIDVEFLLSYLHPKSSNDMSSLGADNAYFHGHIRLFEFNKSGDGGFNSKLEKAVAYIKNISSIIQGK